MVIQGIGTHRSSSKGVVKVNIKPRMISISNFNEEIYFNVLTKLTIPLPSQSFDVSYWNIPENINLADPGFFESGEIDMIIGAEFFLDLLQDGKMKLFDIGPIIHNTSLGWIVSGPLPDPHDLTATTVSYACSTAELQDQLSKFWELETCYVKSTNSIEESACEEMFNQTTTRDDRGRFRVSLPKKHGVIERLGDSRRIAEKRFLNLEKRFAVNPQLKKMYCDFISEYRSMGHMVEVNESDISDVAYYMPHHAVLRPNSTTSKLRVVFDASCRTTSGLSLNDGLMVGPTVQDDLLSIISRFRMHQVAITADIAKMYRMVNVQRQNPGEMLRAFELTTVTYGTASAPFLATRCLQQLSIDGESSHPIAAKILRNDFYVDDLITGVDEPEEGKRLVIEMIDLLNTAGFILRKWNSNCESVKTEIPDDLRDDRSLIAIDASSTVKTLGLTWDPVNDCFTFSVPLRNESSIITKRIVLSDASKLFDPLGLIGPVIVQAKIFMQKLWTIDSNWDDPLSEDLQEYWSEYRKNLTSSKTFFIPRWSGFKRNCVDVQWHGFCDASEKAYGACIYLRCSQLDGSITIQLMTSKSRVAPLDETRRKRKKQSIPRLELSSALLLSHLFDKVHRNIPVTEKAYFWTDSTIVKCWLASSPSRWQVFVANRVSEIQHLTKHGVWNHVPGTENPADILSRGITPQELQRQHSWFNGPAWLHQHPMNWPKETHSTVEYFDSAILEEKVSVSMVTQHSCRNDIFYLRSSFPKLVRLIALIRRFRHNAQERHRYCRIGGPINSNEYKIAIEHLVRLSQQESFHREYLNLAKNKQVEHSSRIRSLYPLLQDDIIRVGGRLRHASVSEDRKHPIILNNHHPLSKLILDYYHIKLYHAGQQMLIASVRERFWITNIRKLARKVIHKCVICFRAKPRATEQLMGDLPPERVTPAPPFLRVGVDYCGPFHVTYPNRRGSPMKCFISIFVCLVTKAVHLELVADLTTEAFLAALKRFIARRGKPITMMCDNAKNFVGANRELKELRNLFYKQQFQNSVVKEMAEDRIDFKFIPARSPNFSGLWEAAVKLFEGAFKRTIGTRVLQYDEMHTVLTQVEAILNSRPLTPLSNDPGDFEALTPSHFLVQRQLTAVAEPDLESVPTNRLSLWQRT
ncbi:uncharacterized protein LOC129781554 [Toxorhynchites rutilus septentrionalis]|uniref:uncharacterized protein LOC129781554 n=1 Tax=Toxorhynchites rutilus septentrionalis TaxID=329112 RepID=UPI00247AA58B|nr:uncharacterized protein LOC129781554 [Toxorhynchites rutilus septentrionalis]